MVDEPWQDPRCEAGLAEVVYAIPASEMVLTPCVEAGV